MERNKKIIIGGGISGLLKAYYDKEAILITERIGGQLKAPFQLGPKYFHVDEYTKRFLSEIGFCSQEITIKKVKIGFFYDNSLHDVNTEKNRKLYFEKTRGENEIYRSSMSAGASEFDSFDIDINEIIDILKDGIKDRIILGKIENINSLRKEITVEGKKYKYEKLISTIPLNTFLTLNNKLSIAKEYKSYPTTFIQCSTDIKEEFKKYDYIYYSEPHFLFHRVTKVGSYTVLEFKGDNIGIWENEIDRFVLKTGQLIQNDIKISLGHIEFFGRYGTWDHSILINTLLKQIYGTK